ncbi:YwmB family TATA-box binding protein [Metabacillus arenae]|uniref:YwmB family TATA-box binding protein n=1 Tax=Metabacillus arenae TaxID=2771434 RepID=A0A926NNL7_9BACI|nr:YwmB family TATA-box binding protein [Metabacillus arenae]MBD1383228.1 YwmB family TATA-box binding protein [Metabacillus arenae]
MKQKFYIFIGVFLIIGIIFSAKNSGAISEGNQLEEIANKLKSQEAVVDEWSLYTKAPVEISRKNFYQFVKPFIASNRQYDWAIQEETDMLKATGLFVDKKTKQTHKLQVITTTHKNNHSQSYILYELKGRGWQKNWNEIQDSFQAAAIDIIHEKSTIFTCVKGHFSDKMEGVLYQKSHSLLKEFNAVPVEQLKEKKFVSVSGYTTDWNLSIPTENGNMNVQVALRSAGLGEKTTVVVGTPILTTEY